MTVDRKKAEQAVQNFLEAFGIDIENRPGMEDTPSRVVKMYEEVWQGEQFDNEDIALAYGKTFTCSSRDMVIVKDIEAFSWCEHHLALIYNMKVSVGYIPNGKVIGLSKIARVVEIVCQRLQLQERIGFEIADILSRILDSQNICIRIEANHSCMTARGIKKPSSKTVTFTRWGAFTAVPSGNNTNFREFLDALKD